jgi:hypothetical protein
MLDAAAGSCVTDPEAIAHAVVAETGALGERELAAA